MIVHLAIPKQRSYKHTMKAVIYARHSSDNRAEAGIESSHYRDFFPKNEKTI